MVLVRVLESRTAIKQEQEHRLGTEQEHGNSKENHFLGRGAREGQGIPR
jgi:hypothetical protein